MDSIEIDETLKVKLAALAGEGRTASDLANDVLRDFVEGTERGVVADTTEDHRRLEEYRRTGEHVTWEEFQRTARDLIARSEAKLKA